MTQTEARIKKEGKNFEILVELEEALKVKKGDGDIARAVLTNDIFYNLKSGEKASDENLKKEFGTSDFMQVAEKIIKNGDIVLPTEYLNKEQEQKYKQVVDFLAKNATNPEGKLYTPNRIMKALQEGNVQVKNKPIDSQIGEILSQIQKIIPIKIEIKKLKIMVPAQFTGQAYGVLNQFKESETWHNNGDLEITSNVPSGLILDFYDKLNKVTHGSALTEEIK